MEQDSKCVKKKACGHKKLLQKHCVFCGSPHARTIDHILPLSRGGDNSLSNKQTLCSFCNSTKGNKTDYELKIILADILAHGVYYKWEQPYSHYIDWLLLVTKERKFASPLLPMQNSDN